MAAPTDPLELAAEFPAASEDEWRTLAAAVVRKAGLADGADPIDALSTTTYEGIRVLPLYTSAPGDPGLPGQQPYLRGSTVDGATVSGWDVRAHHHDPDPARTRAVAVADLERGATSLWLVLGEAGLAVSDLAAALDGVHLDLAPIAIDAGAQTRPAAAALLDLVRVRDLDPEKIAGTLGADPIGLRARTGSDVDLSLLGELSVLAHPFPDLRVSTVDATVYHDAGAGDAGELAVATAVGVAYLRTLTDAGLSLDDALAAIEFRFAVTADQFLSIAKLRAARQMWGRVAELCGASAGGRGQRQHAVTSRAMMTRRDPWVNMLRTTIACFAAAVGGADAITVLPFDAAIGLPDDLARRIARNTHAILHDESSLGRVVDAAGGSWYIETLTDRLAATAWDAFTAIERDGGAPASLDGGRIAALIAATRDRRDDDIAHRRAAITGVSEYALPDEAPVLRSAAPPAPSGGPLPPIRYAQDYEALRGRAEAAQPRPAVFLAVLGPLAEHTARVSFATNLFNAGGLRVVIGPPEEFGDSGTTVACLCSPDKGYGDEAAAAIAQLKAAGACYVWSAGNADTAGADGYVLADGDALDVLRRTLDALDVPS